jgi:hypothetical protein
MVWVRAATRSWRRLVNRCSTTAWSSTPTDSTRTRAASLAGTSRTCSPSLTSRWARARPIPCAPSTAQRRSSHCPAPLAQCPIPHQGGWNMLAVEQLAVIVERGGGGGGLCGGRRRSSPACGHLSRRADRNAPGGQADFGRPQSSVEPLPIGCRQDRTTVLEPAQAERQWRLWSDLPTPWNPTAADPGPLPAFKKSGVRRRTHPRRSAVRSRPWARWPLPLVGPFDLGRGPRERGANLVGLDLGDRALLALGGLQTGRRPGYGSSRCPSGRRPAPDGLRPLAHGDPDLCRGGQDLRVRPQYRRGHPDGWWAARAGRLGAVLEQFVPWSRRRTVAGGDRVIRERRIERDL